jgi:DNA anti-recombination protein RmuC
MTLTHTQSNIQVAHRPFQVVTNSCLTNERGVSPGDCNDSSLLRRDLERANADRENLVKQLNEVKKTLQSKQQTVEVLTRERDRLQSNLTKQLLRVRIANEQRFDRLQQLHDDEVQAIIDAYESG